MNPLSSPLTPPRAKRQMPRAVLLFVVALALAACSNLPFSPGQAGVPRGSEWIVADITDEDETELYMLNPLTGESFKVAQSDDMNGSERSGSGVLLYTDFYSVFPGQGLQSRYTSGINALAYITPDSHRIVTLELNNNLWDLAISDPNGQNQILLIEEAVSIFPTVDATDGIIAATVVNSDGHVSGYVFSLNDGSQVATLFEEVDEGTILPMRNTGKIYYNVRVDGEFVEFIGDHDGSESVEVARMDEDERYAKGSMNIQAVTADGSRLFFRNEKGLQSRPLGAGTPTEIRRGGATVIDLSPKGDQILVSERNEDGTSDLFLIDVAANKATDLVRAQPRVWGTFTHDGQQILIITQVGPSTNSNLVETDFSLYSIADGDSERLLRGEYFQWGNGIVTEGRYYVIQHSRQQSSDQELSIIDAQEGTIEEVPESSATGVRAMDLRNGQLLFTTSEGSRSGGLFLYQIGSQEEPLILDDQASSYGHARFIDGNNRVVFNAYFGGSQRAIYVVNSDGRDRELLLDDAIWIGNAD